ncbi:cytochrome [Streptomyces gilvosporeus]|uniref:Ferredoxin n=2 Tax=Streptomyces gilvosporeus TaxID=553510 RepID=A0A1V0U1L4_9ACTN|nr:cytochrome [Streptomyces gilvosporeus]
MTWRAEIDPKRCMASGMCATIAPELFALGERVSRPVAEEIAADERALDAADCCPALAITVYDEGGDVIGPRP